MYMSKSRTSISDDIRQVGLPAFPPKRRPARWSDRAYMSKSRTTITADIRQVHLAAFPRK
ncbi:hypothetical protein [Fundicoccus culcitae]|uniref:Transposase n=1 Tax=Fundicoccus culcitae TaxID=2969821 RepID=A0ABY5P3P3_9LACT|nr:hypothetical protein [Fundicoccus culcitae]UUX33297.1 hypothetical protein NRE15_10340 [Fundicoccus culcitae]